MKQHLIVSIILLWYPIFLEGKHHDLKFFWHAFDKTQHILSRSSFVKTLAQTCIALVEKNINNSSAQKRLQAQRAYQEQQQAIRENNRFLQEAERTRNAAAITTTTVQSFSSLPHQNIPASLQNNNNNSDNYHKKRKSALEQDINNHWQTYRSNYTLSPDGQKLLNNLDINWQSRTDFCGTRLQHELRQETIECLDKAGSLHENTSHVTVQSLAHIVGNFSIAADDYNQLRAIERSCTILDFCHSLLDYSTAIIDCCIATGEGIIAGVEHTLATAEWLEQQAFDFATHPREAREKFFHSLDKAATSLTLLIRDFCPLTGDLDELYYSEIDHYLDYNQRIVANWQQAISCLWQHIKNTPARELVKGSAQFVTESILLEKSFTALGSLGAAAQHEFEAINYAKFYKIPSGAAPGFLLIDSTHAAQKIISFTERTQITALENVIKALENIELPTIGGNISQLNEAINLFEHTEGFKEVFERILLAHKKECFSTAKGACWELESALQWYNKGEHITAIGKELVRDNIGKLEFDLVTDTKLIECKNIVWIDYENISRLDNPMQKKIHDLRTSLMRHKKLAELLEKKSYVIHSKNDIPEVWKYWLKSKNIKFYEGNIWELIIQ